MPIPKLEDKPITAPQQLPITAEIQPEPYRHSIVDTKVQPQESVLTHLSGSKWTVDYYSQIVSADEELGPFEPTQLPPYLQYMKVVRCELLLQGSLSPQISPNTNVARLVGTVRFYPGLKPKYGDAFIADIGDGVAGQFTILDVRRLTVLTDTAYEAQVELSRQPVDETLMDLLDSKVVKTTYFQKDHFLYGQNPYILEEDYNNKKSLEDYIDDLEQIWIKTFWDLELKTFLIPGQTSKCYDPFVMKIVLSLFDISSHPLYTNIRVLNVDDYGIPGIMDIWTALVSREPYHLHAVFQKMVLASNAAFSGRPRYNGVRFSGVDRVAVPLNLQMNPQTTYDFFGYNNLCVAPGVPLTNATPTETDGTIGTELPVVGLDSYYVLSQAFYENNRPSMTKFERLLRDGIERKAINATDVIPYYNSWYKWSKLDQYYLTPMLVILMRFALRSI